MNPKDLVDLFKAVVESQESEESSRARSASTRDLEIIFYGMACFVPMKDKRAFRVLFPNGLAVWNNVPVHSAGVWARPRSVLATARWRFTSRNNDFFLEEKRQLTVTGLTPNRLDVTGFDDHVTVLANCDPSFRVAANPDAVIEMTVDCGTLTSHYVNKKNMIVVCWKVQVEPNSTVRFDFGTDFIEIPPGVKQVFLANAGKSKKGDHFLLYRKLSTQPTKRLEHPGTPPNQSPQPEGSLSLDHPTFSYATVRTPDIVCSPVQSELSGFAP